MINNGLADDAQNPIGNIRRTRDLQKVPARTAHKSDDVAASTHATRLRFTPNLLLQYMSAPSQGAAASLSRGVAVTTEERVGPPGKLMAPKDIVAFAMRA